MKREIYFRDLRTNYWPALEAIKPYFLAPDAPQMWGESGNDDWAIGIYGFNGTEDGLRFARVGSGQKQQEWAELEMWGDPNLGVMLWYQRVGGGPTIYQYSAGDMSRQNQWTRTLQSDLRPVSLYIPYDKAWLAVKEFMETDGQLPKCIQWISSMDVPSNSFPVPHDESIVAINDHLP